MGQLKSSPVITFLGKIPNSSYSRLSREGRLPLAQNNPHAKVTYLGEACSEPLHQIKVLAWLGSA